MCCLPTSFHSDVGGVRQRAQRNRRWNWYHHRVQADRLFFRCPPGNGDHAFDPIVIVAGLVPFVGMIVVLLLVRNTKATDQGLVRGSELMD